MKKNSMSNFSFFAMTASLFVTVYEYPTFAVVGKALVFYLLLCGFFWFLPVSLCSAELATIEGYQEGGIYSWVGKPLGEKYGFAALFFQWFQVTVGFVTMIYFIVGTLSYVLEIPAMNNDPVFKFVSVVGIFWILTFLQLRGTETTAKMAKLGFSVGIILPVLVLFGYTVAYFKQGHAVSSHFTHSSFLPNKGNIGALTSFVLAYMGVEASATHFSDLKDGKKNYPKLLMVLVIVGIMMSTIGGCVVSTVLTGKISANQGVIDTATQLMSPGHVGLLVKIIGFLTSFGILAQVSSWIVSPTEGLQFAASKHLLPKKLAQKNANNVPVRILMIQGLIVTVWAALLTFGSKGSGGNVGFQTAISLTVLIYLSAYILFFVAYFVLLFKHKSLNREFQIPGGQWTKGIVAGCGLLISIAAVCTAFIVPSTVPKGKSSLYLVSLIVGFVVTLACPFIFYQCYSKRHKEEQISRGSA
ncbi:glutamate:gamma-aminobutyrate antiporter [Enterococcus sp. DIV0421]|uniref:amino acid permease n=1 Tax=Enterococcus TaxID=1350 RepID=UPI000A33BCAC|nr:MULTISPECIES: amino acid permease [Enterococcus]OTO01182.1 glutamate:gamma-aminobutyrate antiporter [Enterococcus sp. 5B3_DIV0040]